MVIEQFCNFGIREPVMYIEPEVPTLKRFWLCQIYFMDKKKRVNPATVFPNIVSALE